MFLPSKVTKLWRLRKGHGFVSVRIKPICLVGLPVKAKGSYLLLDLWTKPNWRSLSKEGPRLTTEMQPSMSLSRSLSEPKFILTRAASAQAILKPNSVKGKKRIAHARASQFSQAGAIEASGIKASPVELSKGVAGQEWLGEEINNEPFKSRNASSRQNDAVGKGGQSAWRSEWW